MFVVQLGHFAWLSTVVPVTTSGAHATRYPDGISAGQAIRAFKADRAAQLAASDMSKASVAIYMAVEPVAVPAAELDARMASSRVAISGANPGPQERAEAKAAGTPAEAPAKRGGVTRAIYQWALDNPTATKKDAQAAFPGANPSTVGVQFGAARKAGT